MARTVRSSRTPGPIRFSTANPLAGTSAIGTGTYAAGLLLILAGLLGGSSGDFPVRAAIIELSALVTLAITAATWRGRSLPRLAWIAIAIVLLMPLLQLIPLPSSLWTALPGREVDADIAQFASPGLWHAMTLDPNATWKSWLSLLVPVALFLATWQATGSERVFLARLLVGIAFVSALLGIVQLIFGPTGPYLFDSLHNGLPVGLFSNRNHQAALMYVGAVIAIALAHRPDTRGPVERAVLIAICTILVTTSLLTHSRAGFALIVAGVVAAMLVSRSSFNWKWFAAAVAVGTIAIWAMMQNEVILAIFARFAKATGDERVASLPDVLYSTLVYQPFGAGLGTFQQAFAATEPLDAVRDLHLNHAHNDYLEFTQDLGVLGPAFLAIFFIVLAVRLIGVFFRRPLSPDRLIARAAGICLLLLLAHSAADYPVRAFALLAVTGLLLGLIFAPDPEDRSHAARAAERSAIPEGRSAEQPVRSRHGALKIASFLLLALIGIQIFGMAASSLAISARAPGLAAALWPSSSRALAERAEASFEAGDLADAEKNALAAVRITPGNSQALRVLARVAATRGDAGRATAAMELAARLGWRDGFVQFWVLERSLAIADYRNAAQAGDALLRIRFLEDRTTDQMRGMMDNARGRIALAARFADDPPWANRFLNGLRARSAADAANISRMIALINRASPQPPTTNLMPFFERAIADGYGVALVDPWASQYRDKTDRPTTGLVDGDFTWPARGRTPPLPFGWLPGADPQVSISFPDRFTGDPMLQVSNSSPKRVTAISQLLVLPPGDYELGYEASLGGSANRFTWRIYCIDNRETLLTEKMSVVGEGWSGRQAAFRIPPATCNGQRIDLIVDAALGDPITGSFDSIAIRRR